MIKLHQPIKEEMSLRVVSQLPLLRVLLNRSVGLVGRHLHLCAALFRDLHHEIKHPVPQFQWDIVPRRDLAKKLSTLATKQLQKWEKMGKRGTFLPEESRKKTL